MNREYDRELRALEDELQQGRISQAEYNAEVKALERYYREAAEEAARDAYDRELTTWYDTDR